MATLYRKKSASGKQLSSWYCFFRIVDKNGDEKQIHRSTGKSTKKEAQEAAAALEKAALDESGAGDVRSKEILGKLTEAAELAMRGRLNAAQARRILGEILIASGEVEQVNYSLHQWTEEWLKEKEATTKKATHDFYRSTIKSFLIFIGDRAANHLETITAQDVRKFRDSIIAEGRTAKTANHKLKGIRSMFGDAVKASALLQNPAISVKQLPETDSTARSPFSIEEIELLVAAAPSADWEGIILLGAFTGLRLTDASNLTAGNIDLERKVVNLMPKKTERKKTTVEIPLHSELVRFFTHNPPSPFPATPLFASLSKVTAGGRNGLSAQFKAIMISAKVSRNVTRRVETGAPRESSERSFHSLRHTFTSALAKANVPEEVRMKMTGHSESSTHQKYTHQELSTLRAGVDLIPGLVQSS